jgi:gliding motility-associated lipoprotein GldH
MHKRLVIGSLSLILLLSFFSCSHKEVFFDFHSVVDASWARADTAVFEVNITDAAIPYDIFVEIRHNEHYPFSNIWLFVNVETPERSVRTDTIGVDLADVYGKWYGKGFSLHNFSIPYEKSFLFPHPGVYTFSICQGMRDNPLKGVSDIGLKISKKSD